MAITQESTDSLDCGPLRVRESEEEEDTGRDLRPVLAILGASAAGGVAGVVLV